MTILNRLFRLYLWACGPYRRLGTVVMAIALSYLLQPDQARAQFVEQQLPYVRIELYIVPLFASGLYLWWQGDRPHLRFWVAILPYLAHLGYVIKPGYLRFEGILPVILYVILLGSTLYARYQGHIFPPPQVKRAVHEPRPH